MNLVAVVQLSLEAEWFRLELRERDNLRRQLFQVLERHPQVSGRWFGADPWTGNGAEFLVCEFSSLPEYWGFWSDLRDQPILSRPYAHIERVSLGYERTLTKGLVET